MPGRGSGRLFPLGQGQRPADPYETKSQGEAVVRSTFPADATPVKQDRVSTTDGTSTEVVAANAGTKQIVELWLDEDTNLSGDACHVAVGEDATSSHPLLEPGDTDRFFTDEAVDILRQASTDVTINVRVWKVDN